MFQFELPQNNIDITKKSLAATHCRMFGRSSINFFIESKLRFCLDGSN